MGLRRGRPCGRGGIVYSDGIVCCGGSSTGQVVRPGNYLEDLGKLSVVANGCRMRSTERHRCLQAIGFLRKARVSRSQL